MAEKLEVEVSAKYERRQLDAELADVKGSLVTGHSVEKRSGRPNSDVK